MTQEQANSTSAEDSSPQPRLSTEPPPATGDDTQTRNALPPPPRTAPKVSTGLAVHTEGCKGA